MNILKGYFSWCVVAVTLSISVGPHPVSSLHMCGAGSAVPREGFDLSVIILASLLVFPNTL